MKHHRLRKFLHSPTANLAATYVMIIMVLSIGFSVVLYHTSSHELGRQIPPNSFFNQASHSTDDLNPQPGQQVQQTPPNVDKFFQERIAEGRQALLKKLILLNISALILGSYVSYVLARRSLQPIEQAMDAQAQFVSDASHELRTPLTAIQASNEVALRNPKLTLPNAKKIIARNTEDIVKLKTLSDGLLNLAQHQKTNAIMVIVNVQDVVSDAMNQVVQQATVKDVAVHDETQNLQALADRVSLTQVLVILLDNAVKYSNPHANVRVSTEVKSKSVLIIISDEGIGIRASDLPHIFRRFYRADSARISGEERSGYGLGLAIAQQIMQQQHSVITATSVLGKGSTFTVTLNRGVLS